MEKKKGTQQRGGRGRRGGQQPPRERQQGDQQPDAQGGRQHGQPAGGQWERPRDERGGQGGDRQRGGRRGGQQGQRPPRERQQGDQQPDAQGGRQHGQPAGGQWERPRDERGGQGGDRQRGGRRGGQQGQRPLYHEKESAPPQPYQPRSTQGSSSEIPDPGQALPRSSNASSSSASTSTEIVKPSTTSTSLGLTKQQWAKVRMPLRANRGPAGKAGRPITVETNHVELTIANINATVFHYDVVIAPEKPFRFYRPAMEEMKNIHYPDKHPAFDGKKNLYSFSRLPFEEDALEGTVTIWDGERNANKEIDVKIKLVNSIKFATIFEYMNGGSSLNPPQEAIQALDIVLRQPAALSFTQVKRSYFTPPNPGQVIRLGGGLDLWYGFFQSAILGGKPFVNIDVAHKGFPSDVDCIVAIENLMNDGQRRYGPPGSAPSRLTLGRTKRVENPILDKFSGLVKGLKVVYRKPIRQSGNSENRTYKVHNVGDSPRDHRFRKETDGEFISVEQYFMDKYNVELKYPLAPCLVVGSTVNPIFLPVELCKIARGQVINTRMDENQTRNMVKAASRPPSERKARIVGSMQKLGINGHPCVKEFGLSISTEFTKVHGRVLKAPTLEYQDDSVTPARGEWKSKKFITAQSLNNWVIYYSRVREPSNLKSLWEGFESSGQQLGMNLAKPNFVEKRRSLVEDFDNFKKGQVQLVVVVIPDFDRDNEFTYANVKQKAETKVGLLTQCLRNRTLIKLSQNQFSNTTITTNILLKVNAKLNGVNHNIERTVWPAFLNRPVIVVGADVTHPPANSGSSKTPTIPSVAAVAASHDPNAFKYNMLWRLQEPREEMIVELEDIMKEQLMFFYRSNNQLKPEAIYFYRDGVSEGQFSHVLQIEVEAIKRACKAVSTVNETYEPPITFLVVQKRHHTRFFPIRAQDEEGKSQNVPAGTVIDTVITHPVEMDFYLVSHASIQGTARPTKYHVLYEDVPLPEATLEEITFYLCHLFTRCTRSVSYPAPTYYAHLAAFRIRHYMERSNIEMGRLKDMEKSLGIKQSLTDSHPMFFV